MQRIRSGWYSGCIRPREWNCINTRGWTVHSKLGADTRGNQRNNASAVLQTSRCLMLTSVSTSKRACSDAAHVFFAAMSSTHTHCCHKTCSGATEKLAKNVLVKSVFLWKCSFGTVRPQNTQLWHVSGALQSKTNNRALIIRMCTCTCKPSADTQSWMLPSDIIR